MLNSEQAKAVILDFIKSIKPYIDPMTEQSLKTMTKAYVNKKSQGEGWSGLEELQASTKENNAFNLETEYQNYLVRVKLSESSMSETQAVETKRAFMAGCGSMLILMGMLGQLKQDKAFQATTDMLTQVNLFWQKQEMA